MTAMQSHEQKPPRPIWPGIWYWPWRMSPGLRGIGCLLPRFWAATVAAGLVVRRCSIAWDGVEGKLEC